MEEIIKRMASDSEETLPAFGLFRSLRSGSGRATTTGLCTWIHRAVVAGDAH